MIKTLPPTKNKEFWGEEADTILITEPEQTFKSEKGHRWVQQGPYLVCKSCVLKHSMYIGTDKRLVGFNEDGSPKLENI